MSRNGKLVVRRGRKVMGLLGQIARLPKVFCGSLFC